MEGRNDEQGQGTEKMVPSGGRDGVGGQKNGLRPMRKWTPARVV